MDDDAKLPPLIEFGFAQTLTADKRLLAIADYGACVKTHSHALMCRHCCPRFDDSSYDANFDSGANTFSQQSDHLKIADLGIVDQQLLLRSFNETRQQLARIHRAHNQIIELWAVGLPLDIRLEQLRGFMNDIRVVGDDPEATTVLDVEMGKVESQ